MANGPKRSTRQHARHARISVQLLSLPRILPRRHVWLPILMYHRIGSFATSSPAITRALTVSSSDFRAQMRWLVGNGFHAVSDLQVFDALEKGRPLPPKSIMITFDDGYRDVLWNAVPTLYRLHFAATVYVITSRVSGADSSFLTWPELKKLEALGVSIGSHTVHHLELPALTTKEALAELEQSRWVLQRNLGHPVQWFAYPSGSENARTQALVRRAGYVLAVTTQPGAMQSGATPLALYRYEVLDTTGVAGIRALLRRVPSSG